MEISIPGRLKDAAADKSLDSARPPAPGGRRRHLRRRVWQAAAFTLFRAAAAVNAAALLILVGFLVMRGAGAVSWNFLTEAPREAMTQGGIFPCIVGTVVLSLGAMLVAFPLGVASGVYLSEYARPGKLLRVVRLGINNLAGVPSVVFGLFGLAVFVTWMKLGVSIASGALTLGVLTLPVIISSTEEALRAVPATYREASLALGGTRWQTTFRVVLPAALPGVLTGGILGLARAAGETAPIMFTAAVFYSPVLPRSLSDQVMALPYHIYVLATAGTNIDETRPLQYGTALVLIALVFGMNLLAIVYRSRLRRKR